MKRFIMCFLLAIACMFCIHALAVDIVEPTITKQTAEWWMTRYGKEKFEWTDHLGHKSSLLVPTTNEVIKASGGYSGVAVEFNRDLQWTKYVVKSGHLNPDYSYNIENIAPGEYVPGKFYTQLSVEEKTGLWVAYTNQVIQAHLDHLAKKFAPAKFDVSTDPEEYKEQLMEGRTPEDLTPEERREINSEYRKYYDEWLRVHDPDKWDFQIPMPGKEIVSEQSKKGRLDRDTLMNRARERRMLRSKQPVK